jgi:ABC-2 type transport system permease protein
MNPAHSLSTAASPLTANSTLMQPGGPRLPTPAEEARAFWRLRRRTFVMSLKKALATSRLRVSLVAFLSVFFWCGLFVLFDRAFWFLSSTIGNSATHAQTVQAIYNVFFASLMVMLIFSSGIILYSGLFSSSEAALLLSTPARPERIVLHKFQESLFFSSWGFFLLGSPMLVAYGWQSGAPWYYYVLLLPFMLAFIYIPGALGAILCLIVVHRIPQARLHSMAITLIGTLMAGLLIGWVLWGSSERNLLTPLWFQDMLSRLQFSEHRLLPSWWLSTGLLLAARLEAGSPQFTPWAESVMFLVVLLSNAMFLHVLLGWVGNRIYRQSFSELLAERTARRPRANFWADRFILYGAPFLSRQMRLLLVKDIRVFRRDPVQWSQFLIFFGLLVLYFINIRRFSYDVNYAGWVNMISFLNLAVVGLILSTFTTRFIFPMLSLEGRRFWILGLLPIDRDSILWGKFVFAGVGACVPCCVLILLSDLMLNISPVVMLIHQTTCLLLCVGLAGIAVGLGAKMPDLTEDSPSKIAAGFGGTLNLVLSAIYIVAVVLLTALPSHFYMAAPTEDEYRLWWLGAMAVGNLLALAIGVIATGLPMRMGLRAFRAMEF